MNRRTLLKSAVKLGGAAMAIGILTLFAGCNDQATISALLREMSAAWMDFENSLGKSVPVSITTAFSAAVAAVNAWVPGTPSQDVVQVLQDLAKGISSFAGLAGGLTGLEALAVSIILSTVATIIETIDPNAVPPVVSAAQATLRHMATPPPASPPPALSKNLRRGAIRAADIKKQFEIQWLAVTGKKPA